MLKKSLMLLTVLFFSSGAFAQSVEEAGAKYNEGNQKYNAKEYAQAIDAYKAALEMANQAGPEADELKNSIEKQLGNTYYKNGIALYKAKNLDGSLLALDKGYAFSKEIDDAKLKAKFVSVISQIRSKKGDALRKENKLDEAYAEYEMGLKIKPTCVKAFYGQGLVHKEKGEMGKMMEKMDKVIENGKGDSKAAKTVAAAKSTAAKTLFNTALTALQDNKAEKAIEYINYSFKYADGNADTYYYLAVSYNKAKKWRDALQAAEKALTLKEGDKSDIYFEQGQAFEGSGDNTNACGAYKKVTAGVNVEPAKYKVTQTLKCG
ncbi:MAG: hypothetical protein L3J31_00525 [Bacteroidales bacterium]|nr:hypothetical protein [Bacteroidales bacterium]MCF6341274.1 hypothetical protein [Bacteroidales bacterium]